MSTNIKESDELKDFIVFDVEEYLTKDEDDNDVKQAGFISDTVKKSVLKKSVISVEKIQNQIDEFIEKIFNVLSNTTVQKGDFKLNTVEINAQISAEGQIGFMGTHATLNGMAGIKFVFTKIDTLSK